MIVLCPICNGNGWYPWQNCSSLPWEAEQKQCEKCLGEGKLNMKTCACGKLAVWLYAPDSEYFACDDCVPRGCSCNAELKDGVDYESPEAALPENWTEPVDEKGRKYPCCEWFYDAAGWEETVTGRDVLQSQYEESLKREDTGDAKWAVTKRSDVPPWALP
jgi:hypothetical protein